MYSDSLITEWQSCCWNFNWSLPPSIINISYKFEVIRNPLRAKFSRGNINIYLHFVSFRHIDTTQLVKILPQIRREPTYSI